MLKKRLLKWVIGIIAVVITVWLMSMLQPGLQLKWDSPWRIVIFVPVLALVNSVIGTVVRIFALPINCMTLGLFGFVVNALMFWLAGRLTGAHSGASAPIGFLVSLIGSVLYTVISAPLSSFIKERS